MLEGLKRELVTRDRVDEYETLLAEAAGETPEDAVMDQITNGDAELSPEEQKQCEDVLKTIPEFEEPKEDITKEDVDAAKAVHEPTIEELAENMVII